MIQFLETVIGVLLLAPGLVFIVTIIWAIVRPYSRLPNQLPTTTYIFAAHSDDCVIMAGEYGASARESGFGLNIIYLTCGDHVPKTRIALQRRAEAIKAWGLVGVKQDHFHFLDLPQTDLSRTEPASSLEQLCRAGQEISKLLLNAASGDAVILPAFGESHVDHRILRKLVLAALSEIRRNDLLVLEGPEYNSFYSLIHSPYKTFFYVWRQIPLVGRLFPSFSVANSAGFVSGPRAVRMNCPDKICRTKLKMLKTFESQGVDKLLKFFGRHDELRVVQNILLASTETEQGYFNIGKRKIDFSVICLWVTIVEIVLLAPILLIPKGFFSHYYVDIIILIWAMISIPLIWKRKENFERKTLLTAFFFGMGLAVLQ